MNGMALILGGEKASIEKLAEHIDYISNLTGSVDNITLGLDLIYFHDILPIFLKRPG